MHSYRTERFRFQSFIYARSSRVQTWAEECVHLHKVLPRLNSAHDHLLLHALFLLYALGTTQEICCHFSHSHKHSKVWILIKKLRNCIILQ